MAQHHGAGSQGQEHPPVLGRVSGKGHPRRNQYGHQEEGGGSAVYDPHVCPEVQFLPEAPADRKIPRSHDTGGECQGVTKEGSASKPEGTVSDNRCPEDRHEDAHPLTTGGAFSQEGHRKPRHKEGLSAYQNR